MSHTPERIAAGLTAKNHLAFLPLSREAIFQLSWAAALGVMLLLVGTFTH